MSEFFEKASEKCPVTIITGFLGSGKTRFLSELLSSGAITNAAVIINEFGEFSLDHLLVEYTRDQIFELPDGCLCCSANGELTNRMMELIDKKQRQQIDFDHLIIETSGLADTTNLVANLWNHPAIRNHFQLSGIITVISAIEWSQIQTGFIEAEGQLAIGDGIIITKTDLLPEFSANQQLAHLKAIIESVNKTAKCYVAPLSSQQLVQVVNPFTDISNHSVDHAIVAKSHNLLSYHTCSLHHNLPIPLSTIEFFMDILLTRHADILLRAKGLVLSRENPDRPLVVQAVGSTLSPFSWLKAWDMDPQTRLTLIHTGKNNDIFEELFNNILNIPSIDQPDKAALSNNPLSITGLGSFPPK